MENKKNEKAPKVIVVMPAFNAAKTLESCYYDIPKECVSKVLLVDDVSRDETVEISRKLGIETIVHIQNKGYGGNQKTCYIEALKNGADIIVMLHPDHQYDSRQIPQLIEPIIKDGADLVLGSRMMDGSALKNGMPLYKFIANKFLTFIENLVLRKKYSEYHTGFRAYSRRLLTTVPFLLNSDNFVFDTEVVAQTVVFGFKIAEVPTPARYFEGASSVNFKTSTIYGLSTLWVMLKYILFKLGLAKFKQFSLTLKEVMSNYHWAEIEKATGKNDLTSATANG